MKIMSFCNDFNEYYLLFFSRQGREGGFSQMSGCHSCMKMIILTLVFIDHFHLKNLEMLPDFAIVMNSN